MLTVDAALALLIAQVQPLAPAEVALADVLDLVLAEEIASEIDSPPFDKALMDGYAVRSADVAHAPARLSVIEEVTAGRQATKPLRPGEAIRIMTGAPLPQGADAVVRLEDTRLDAAGSHVEILACAIAPGTNLARKGSSMQRGEALIPAGKMLRPQEMGVLAEIGRSTLRVHPKPRVAILATGDELVSVDQEPAGGQIRNSNETMLIGQIRRAGGIPVPLGIARDNRSDLDEKIARGLQADVLILSGGVSAGALDLVPAALADAGVQKIFHQVDLKPGRPIWCGCRPANAGATEPGRVKACWVFGLPGNPVSSMVCFALFARTALRRLRGLDPATPEPLPARLEDAHELRGDRPTYHPAVITQGDLERTVKPVRWQGSFDLRGAVEANGMVLFPEGNRTYAAGALVDVFAWD